MNLALAKIVGGLSATCMVAVIFGLLWAVYRQRQLAWWGVAWVSLLVRYALAFYLPPNVTYVPEHIVQPPVVLYASLYGLSVICVCRGVDLAAGWRAVIWPYAAVPLVWLWFLLNSQYFWVPVLAFMGPYLLFLSFLKMFVGWRLVWVYRRRNWFGVTAGAALALWGLGGVVVPLITAHQPNFAPWQAFLGASSESLVAITLLVFFFQEKRQELWQSLVVQNYFLASLSHELRTPLAGVWGMLELLEGDGNLSPRQKRHLQMAKGATRTMRNLVNQLLDLSRLKAGGLPLETRDFSPGELLEDSLAAVRPAALAQGLWLEIVLDPRVPPWLKGDAQRLRQVLTNLVANAVKFTRQGGVILSLDLVSQSHGRAKLSFAVQDTGQGISEPELERIFEPFHQAGVPPDRRHGGSGLGLAISRELVASMGGKLAVHSQPARGSKFFFTLRLPLGRPVSPGQPGAATLPDSPRMRLPSRPPLRVLVAEDNAINREYLLEVLSQEGHRTAAVNSGTQAVEAVRLAGEPFDLILLDLQMPGLSGQEAARAIRELEKNTERHTPLAAITAQARPADRQSALAAGFDAYLPKPFGREELAALVAELLPPPPPEPGSPAAGSLPGGDAAWAKQAVQPVLPSPDLGRRFRAEAPGRLAEMSAALSRGDREELARLAHSLRGSLLLFRAEAAQNAAARLEQAALNGGGPETLTRQLFRLDRATRSFVAGLPAGPQSYPLPPPEDPAV
ncbi:MAG: response regulator [Deltaproteobacteria bacterium]|nr:response regulator [Deltaproteobacteria bacterium]